MFVFFNFEGCIMSFMVFSGLLSFCFMRNHLLLTLLSLEFLGLSLFFMFFIFLIMFDMSDYFILGFLTFMVCEGAMGLGILVSLIRVNGNDSVLSLSVLGYS